MKVFPFLCEIKNIVLRKIPVYGVEDVFQVKSKSFELSAACQVHIHLLSRGSLCRFGTRLDLVISDCN